jgi:hypothetical protein
LRSKQRSGLGRDREEYIRLTGQPAKFARTDADDRPRLSIDVDGASDGRRLGVEPALPQGE